MIGSTKEGLIGSKGMELAGSFAEEFAMGLAIVLGAELSIFLTRSMAGTFVESAGLILSACDFCLEFLLGILLKNSTSFSRFLLFEDFGLGIETGLPLDGEGELFPLRFGIVLLTGKDEC